MIKFLFFGDIVGKTGRRAIKKILPDLRQKYQPDLVLANGENIAHGKGMTLSTAQELFDAGIDFFTTGNHVFDKPESRQVFETYTDKVIRPANYPATLPGAGHRIVRVKQIPVLILNLNGQVFMEKQFDHGMIANPFETCEKIVKEMRGDFQVSLLDFHAEATSEKRSMGLWADGMISGVFGTHTHVATNDAQILPLGTGYLTDVGMVGARGSVIGVDKEGAINRLIAGEDTLEKVPLEISDSNEYEISYLFLEIDEESGKCKNIENRTIYASETSL